MLKTWALKPQNSLIKSEKSKISTRIESENTTTTVTFFCNTYLRQILNNNVSYVNKDCVSKNTLLVKQKIKINKLTWKRSNYCIDSNKNYSCN